MNIVRRCVTGQRQRRRTGPHGSRANPALSDPRVSPNWRIRPENAARFALPEFGWTLAVGVVRPKSRGQIRLTGPDPTDPVQIEANMLSDSDELKAAMAGVELCREIGNSAPLRPFAKREVMPGTLKGAALERFVRDAASPYWHPNRDREDGPRPHVGGGWRAETLWHRTSSHRGWLDHAPGDNRKHHGLLRHYRRARRAAPA
jgi:choline dehydrogenase-like flavoprotein